MSADLQMCIIHTIWGLTNLMVIKSEPVPRVQIGFLGLCEEFELAKSNYN